MSDSDSDVQLISPGKPTASSTLASQASSVPVPPSAESTTTSEPPSGHTEALLPSHPQGKEANEGTPTPASPAEPPPTKKKPRPKPKPKARAPPRNASQAPASATPTPAATTVEEPEDEYARFIYKQDIDFVLKNNQSRSRQPSASTSKSPEKSLSPGAKRHRSGRTVEISEDDNDSHSDSSDSSPKRKRRAKRSHDNKKGSKKKAGHTLNLGVDLDSTDPDSDSDASSSHSTTNKKDRKKGKSPAMASDDGAQKPNKRLKRELTPTRELDPIEVRSQQSKYQQEMRLQEAQRQVFMYGYTGYGPPAPRSSRYGLYEDPDESVLADLSVELDPAIKAAVSTAAHEKASARSGRDARAAAAAEDLGFPVRIRIEMVHFSRKSDYDCIQTDSGYANLVQRFETPFEIEVLSKATFASLFATVAAKCSFYGSDQLVLENKEDNSRIWPSSTPQGRKIVSSATFKGYQAAVYEEVLRQRQEERLRPSIPPLGDYSRAQQQQQQTSARGGAAEGYAGGAGEDEDDSEYVDLQLRHRTHGVFKCQVKKTNTFRQLLKYYMKQHSIPVDKLDAAGTQLLFDDEPLDLKAKIADTEVENEDLVEVIC